MDFIQEGSNPDEVIVCSVEELVISYYKQNKDFTEGNIILSINSCCPVEFSLHYWFYNNHALTNNGLTKIALVTMLHRKKLFVHCKKIPCIITLNI